MEVMSHFPSKSPSDLTFHIVYTPGSVKYLYLFLLSLLKWSDCSFRLVANGCKIDEVAILQTICRKNSRLELLALPFQTMVSHGTVLNYLISRSHERYFCFMDSDILATGEFLNDLVPHLSQYIGVFSASPFWCQDEEQVLSDHFPKMQGRHNKTAAGDCLGGTYFAIYHRKVISQLIQITNVGFERFWWSEIPSLYQRRLIQKGIKKEKYDTGKLLNFLLLEQGESLLFKNSSSLYHIGGVSAYNTFTTALPWVCHLKDRLFQIFKKQHSQRITELYQIQNLSTLGLTITNEEWMTLMESHSLVSKRRLTTSRYITHLLRALFEHSALPAIPNLDEPELTTKLEFITKNILAVYHEYREQLVTV